MLNSKLTLISALALMNLLPGLLTTGFVKDAQSDNANRVKHRKVHCPSQITNPEILQHNAGIDAKNEAKRLRKLSARKS